jgi:hypothetical protein
MTSRSSALQSQKSGERVRAIAGSVEGSGLAGKKDAPCIVGLDPGLSGALAFYWPDHPEIILAEDMPVADKRVDAASLAERLRQMRPDFAIVEAVGAMPGQGVSSTFKFGMAFGEIIGVLGALQIPYHLTSATRWKKHFHLTSDKEASRALALRLWPAHSTTFNRKKDHGRAEASLLARFGAETLPQFKSNREVA